MAEPHIQTFEFTTKSVPQTNGVGGANWENLPLASFPPSFDLSIPDSFGNALSTALTNVAASFSGLSNTLKTITQDLQNAACSFGALVDSLQAAQTMAEEFADENNKTRIYVRPIGLQPPGTINSLPAFLNSMRTAINDTGSSAGQIPKIIPAEIPLDPNAIANALGAGGGLVEQFLQGSSGNLNPGVGGTLGTLLSSVSVSTGAGLRKLSNDDQFQNGFTSSSFGTNILALIRESATAPELKIVLQDKPPGNPNDLVGKKVTIKQTVGNDGTYTITGFSDGSVTQQPNSVINALSAGLIGATQTNASNAQAALSPFIIKIDNPAGSNRGPGGTVSIATGDVTVPARDKIRTSLTSRGLLQPNKRRTLPVTGLVDILIQDKIVAPNPDVAAQDKNIAIERLSRLTSPSDFKVGGMVLVGQSPDLPALATKVTALSGMMTFLAPLAEQLVQAAAAEATKAALNPSGIYFDPATINLAKLSASKNVGVLDAQTAAKKAQDSGVLNFTMPELVSLAKDNPQPAANNFNAWRYYSPTDLFPLLGLFGGGTNFQENINQFESSVATTTGAVFANTFGTLGDMIETGINSVNSGLSSLASKASAVDGIVGQMNALNDQMTDGINFLKSQLGKGPLKIDAHMIGAQLDLLSNAQYGDAVEQALRDFTDPNRPTFGPPASSSVLDNQSNINAATQGLSPPARNNRLWFGILIFIVGNGREDLGRQMRTMANLLGMDDSSIDLPKKPKLKLTLKGLEAN